MKRKSPTTNNVIRIYQDVLQIEELRLPEKFILSIIRYYQYNEWHPSKKLLGQYCGLSERCIYQYTDRLIELDYLEIGYHKTYGSTLILTDKWDIPEDRYVKGKNFGPPMWNIPAYLYKTELTLIQILILSTVNYFYQKNGKCYVTKETMAKNFRVNKRSITRNISILIELGIIKRSTNMKELEIAMDNIEHLSKMNLHLPERKPREKSKDIINNKTKCKHGLVEIIDNIIYFPFKTEIGKIVMERLN